MPVVTKHGRQWTRHGESSPEFVNKTKKRRKKDKVAKKSRARNRG